MDEAIIRQKVEILDPTTLPGYMKEVDRYKKFARPGKHLYTTSDWEYQGHFDCQTTNVLDDITGHIFYPEGPKPYGRSSFDISHTIALNEFNRVISRAAIGEVLYPRAIEYLQPLNISEIFGFKDIDQERVLEEISNLEELRSSTQTIAHMLPEFYAQIKPEFGMGTDVVRISLSNHLPRRHYPRAIKIEAEFDDPQSSLWGLRGLEEYFPEIISNEELFIGKLPEKIMYLYEVSDDYFNDHLDNIFGYADKNDFDENIHREMSREAVINHLNFLDKTLQRLDIIPHSAVYHDNNSNLDYNISITTFDEVIMLIAAGYYDGVDIPTIIGTFYGREVELNFQQVLWDYDFKDCGLRVKSMEKADGTLENILQNVTS